MDLIGHIKLAIAADEPLVRINTSEPDQVIKIFQTLSRYAEIKVWDSVMGLRPITEYNLKEKDGGTVAPLVQVLRNFSLEEKREIKKGENLVTLHKILVIPNLYRLLTGDRASMLIDEIMLFYSSTDRPKRMICTFNPADAQLPKELQTYFSVIDHSLPDQQALKLLLETELGFPASEQTDRAATAALGLTRQEAENLFSVSQAQFNCLEYSYIWSEKAKVLNKEGLVTIKETDMTFNDVGGLDAAKNILKRLVVPTKVQQYVPDARAKGVMVFGLPGTGKSLLAYCLGNETGLSTVMVNPANLRDKYVGESEQKTKKMFEILARMAPCIAVVDEAGLLFSGNSNDSGVDQRILSSFLTNMNDMKEQVFWFFTANSISSMPDALLRAERIDLMLYAGLPSQKQRAIVWKMYLNKYFPKMLGNEPNEDGFDLTVDIAAYTRKLKDDKSDKTIQRIAVRLLVEPVETQNDVLDGVRHNYGNEMASRLEANLVNDEKRTPAEISTICRLACLLGISIQEADRQVPRVVQGPNGEKMLKEIEDWAKARGVLDAQTGLVVGTYPTPVSSKRRIIEEN